MTENPLIAARRVDAVKVAQAAISKALRDLEEATGKSIEDVRVDTRSFANLDVEIWLTNKERR